MKTTTFKDGISAIETEKIEARKIISSYGTDVLEIHLQPEAEIESHTTDENAFFYILEGTVKITIDNISKVVEAGSIFECPGGISKAFSNNSSSLAKILSIKMSS